MADTAIEWTDKVWNPVRGCAIVSEGCRNCYAMRQAHRFSGPGRAYEGLTKLTKHGPHWTGRARFVRDQLEVPRSWTKPSRVFVNSMSDLFHEDISFEQIGAVFGVMAGSPRHTFQVLTKRPERMVEFFRWVQSQDSVPPTSVVEIMAANHCDVDQLNPPWPLPNVWLGVSVEDGRTSHRIDQLKQVPAAVRFISFEPLLGPVYHLNFGDPACAKCSGRGWVVEYSNCECGDLDDEDEERSSWCDEQHEWPCGCALIHWLILGGESGPGARPCHVNYLGPILHQARVQGVRAFVKQLGARPDATDSEFRPYARLRPDPKASGRLLLDLKHPKGGDPAEWPADLRVRQWPEVRHGH